MLAAGRPQKAGNNTSNYARTVAQSLGVSPTTPLNMSDPQVISGLVHGITVAENGQKAVNAAMASVPQGAVSAAGSTAPSNGNAAPAAAAGWTLGKPAGAPYQTLTANQVPNGIPGTVYKRAPNGDITVLQEPQWTPKDMLGMREKFQSSPSYQNAATSVGALTGLNGLVADHTQNGVTDMAALDAYLRALNPKGAVRTGTVQVLMDHLGLPAEVQGKVSGAVGNGFLSQGTLQTMGRAIYEYAKEHRDQAAQQMQSDTALATKHGFGPDDLGETLPDMPSVPGFAQDPLPPQNQRVTGRTYWSPRGPAKWTGKGWRLQ